MENETGKTETPNTTPRVRTYERDVAEFLKKEEGTAAKFALAEQNRRIAGEVRVQSSPSHPLPKGEGFVSAEIKTPLRLADPPPRRAGSAPPLRIRAGGEQAVPIPSPHMENLRRNARSLVLWSVLFLVLAGVVGIGYWYFINLPPRAPASVSVDGQKILLADTEKTINTARLARETFLSQFARERAATLALSSFVRIVPTKPPLPPSQARGTPPYPASSRLIGGQAAGRQGGEEEGEAQALTTAEFLSLLEARADGAFVRALAPSFALGLRGLPQNRAFLVFKTPYYRTALAGLLQWEPSLLHDLGPLFGSPSANSGVGASAEALAGRATGFTDRTLQNRDVRVFLGEDGKPLILWSFANQHTVIIADDEDTFQKVLERLVATK